MLRLAWTSTLKQPARVKIYACQSQHQSLFLYLLHPKRKEKELLLKVMLKKATKVHVYVQCLSFFPQG